MDKSPRFKLNKEDGAKIFKGLAIAMGGAGITYLLGIVDIIDVEWSTPLIVGLASSVLNALQRWITNQQK